MQAFTRVRSILSVAAVMATMGLGGCVAYPDGYDSGYGGAGYYGAPAYSPAYVGFGGGYLGSYGYRQSQPRGYTGWGYSGGRHSNYQSGHGGHGGRPDVVHSQRQSQPHPHGQSREHWGGRRENASDGGDRGRHQGGPRGGGHHAGYDPGRQ